ncbi:hypothetical protein R3I93_016686 [Phoxinus phoxinus]|uniref:Uncharacterized protein n=1 Tax=Phoxinus phoxinus TaxID=58324 RepID=A0AAN9CML2_9TELE
MRTSPFWSSTFMKTLENNHTSEVLLILVTTHRFTANHQKLSGQKSWDCDQSTEPHPLNTFSTFLPGQLPQHPAHPPEPVQG